MGRERERDGAPNAVRHWAGAAQPRRSDRTHVGPRGVTHPSRSVPVGKFPGRMLLSDGDLRSFKSSPLPNRYALLRLLLLRRPRIPTWVQDTCIHPGDGVRCSRPSAAGQADPPAGRAGAADKSGRPGGRDCGNCERRESPEVSLGQRGDRGRYEPSTGCRLPRCRPAWWTCEYGSREALGTMTGLGLTGSPWIMPKPPAMS